MGVVTHFIGRVNMCSATSMPVMIQVVIGILSIYIAKVHGLTCEEYLEIPPEKKVSKDNLESMQPKDIVECLVHLGREMLPPDEAKFIWKTIIQFHEGIANIPEEVLAKLHWITVAITPEEYQNITFSTINVVQNFGLNYNLNEAQLFAIADRVRKDFAGKEPEDYTYYDLTAIRQILCVFNRTEIERIPPLSYKEAALLIGKLENCSADTLSGFATLAAQERAFGPMEDWTADTIKLIGNVADYIPKEILVKFKSQQKPI